MAPRFLDFFKSCYYSNTYIPPVDLSDGKLSEQMFSDKDQNIATKAQQLISTQEVQGVLSSPLSYDSDEIKKKNAILEKHGFKLLSSTPIFELGKMGRIPFYSVVEHDQLPGWVIKSGAIKIPKDELLITSMNDQREVALNTNEDSLMSIEMCKRIEKVAKKSNIEVILPKKKLVAYTNTEGVSEPQRKYCVVCEKNDVLSAEDTIDEIRKMDDEQQKKLARKISTLVQKVGFVNASFDNIRLTKERTIAIIDTEPAGLMVKKKLGLWNKLF